MQKNVGSVDKIIRIVLGLGLLSLLVLLQGPSRWWGLVGFIPLATVALSWCPLYTLVGVNTCKRED